MGRLRRAWWRVLAAVLPASWIMRLLPPAPPPIAPSRDLERARRRTVSGEYLVPEADRKSRKA